MRSRKESMSQFGNLIDDLFIIVAILHSSYWSVNRRWNVDDLFITFPLISLGCLIQLIETLNLSVQDILGTLIPILLWTSSNSDLQIWSMSKALRHYNTNIPERHCRNINKYSPSPALWNKIKIQYYYYTWQVQTTQQSRQWLAQLIKLK